MLTKLKNSSAADKALKTAHRIQRTTQQKLNSDAVAGYTLLFLNGK
jgi:cellobiose-specific phosphotransferase system component IIA